MSLNITHTPLTGLAITQANDYYPFGMAYTPKLTGLQPHAGADLQSVPQKT